MRKPELHLPKSRYRPLSRWSTFPKEARKPNPRRSINALSFVQSDLTVIYDAEDRPDPHQLKIAALHMLSGPPSLACLQAQLAVDNARTNFLTRQFAVEYSALFDGLLPFLAFDQLVVPLGGTSKPFQDPRAQADRRMGSVQCDGRR